VPFRPLDPGWEKVRIRIQDPNEQTFFGLKYLRFFDADPGWKKFKSGIRDGKSQIQDKEKHPGSATLVRWPKIEEKNTGIKFFSRFLVKNCNLLILRSP
jgi:hypothetical protein